MKNFLVINKLQNKLNNDIKKLIEWETSESNRGYSGPGKEKLSEEDKKGIIIINIT